MKTAVEAGFIGKDRTFNRRFLRMCSHYLVEPTACTPAAGWEKGQVENQVDWCANAFHPAAAVPDLWRAERLADRPVRRLCQGASPCRTRRADDLAGVRGGTAAACRLCRPV
jgi:hypothetical protein